LPHDYKSKTSNVNEIKGVLHIIFRAKSYSSKNSSKNKLYSNKVNEYNGLTVISKGIKL